MSLALQMYLFPKTHCYSASWGGITCGYLRGNTTKTLINRIFTCFYTCFEKQAFPQLNSL